MSRRAWVEQLMGMPMSIHVRADDPNRSDIERAVQAAYTELARMEDLFTTYRADSQLSRLRRGELTFAGCDPLVAAARDLGEQAREVTGGAFTTQLPDGAGGFAFDPTGLVKGWAVDRAGDYLAGLAGVSWCINAGGDVLAGRHRYVPPPGVDAAPWRIGVENPHDRAQVARVVTVESGAVATSGTAARGAHLYDPVADVQVGRAGSSTVVGPTLLWADIWATALFVGGTAAREHFAAQAEYSAFDL